jgi:hypothetical protein
MQVKIHYRRATALALPAGQIKLHAHLEIDFEPDIEPDADEVIYADISATVTAALSPSDPPQLLGLFGSVGDLANWDVAPRVLGTTLWNAAMAAVEGQIEESVLEIDEGELADHQPAWRELVEAGRRDRVVSLPRRSSDEFEILTSDPDFFRKGRELLRWLFAPEE